MTATFSSRSQVWQLGHLQRSIYCIFEHGRRERGGITTNPNDPMENPAAFNTCMRVGENVDADGVMMASLENGTHGVLGNHTQRHMRRRSRGSSGGLTAEFGTEQSHFDHSVTHTSPQSDHKRNMSKGGSSIKNFSSSSIHNKHKSRRSSFNDHENHRSTAIPKFGTWDVTNPKSGEGYTAIFGKIKEERQIKSSHVSSISSIPPLNNSNIKNQYGGSSFWLSKYCCCCFQAKANEREI